MATNTGFAPHETINVHEALRAAAICLSQMEMMQPLVKDAELKRFIDQQISSKKQDVQELENWAQKIIA